MISKCPHCQKVFEVEASWKDKNATCDSCRNVFCVEEHTVCPDCKALTPIGERCQRCSVSLVTPPALAFDKTAFPQQPPQVDNRIYSQSKMPNQATPATSGFRAPNRNLDKAVYASIPGALVWLINGDVVAFFLQPIISVALLMLYFNGNEMKLTIFHACFWAIYPIASVYCGIIMYQSVRINGKCRVSKLKRLATYVFNTVMIFGLIVEFANSASVQNVKDYNFKVLIYLLLSIVIYNKAWSIYKKRSFAQQEEYSN